MSDPGGLRVEAERLAARVVPHLVDGGHTVAVAESLTGGLLCATLASVPGVSQVLRGGVVAYATELKHELLGVDRDLLARGGAVQPQVATQMAAGVAGRLGAAVALATTGVAGPDPQDGRPPGTVYVALHGLGADAVIGREGATALAGDRAQVRWGAVLVALGVLMERVGPRG